jgi:opacity protein-like surface antigen
MRTLIATLLFCFLLCASDASAQAPIPSAVGRTLDATLGYSYVIHSDNFSNRVGLRGVNASMSVGSSRLALELDAGYARASNVYGTARHSDVFSLLAGPIFYPKHFKNVDTYVHVLGGIARGSGPVHVNGGQILLGGWAWGFAWAAGGGVDYWLTDSLAIRSGFDYMRTEYYGPTLALQGQSNLKMTAAVVYFFGQRSRTTR